MRGGEGGGGGGKSVGKSAVDVGVWKREGRSGDRGRGGVVLELERVA
jgi:hypothetical protein